MKRALFILFFSIIFLILSNIFYYLDTYKWQINTQKDILHKQSEMVRNELDLFTEKTNATISLLISKKELRKLFETENKLRGSKKRIQLLFTSIKEKLNKLTIYNKKGECHSVEQAPNGEYSHSFSRSRIVKRDKKNMLINPGDNSIIYFQPITDIKKIIGHIELDMDMNNFFSSALNNFNIEGAQYQWVIKSPGTVVYNSLRADKFSPDLNDITDNMGNKDWFYKVHNVNVNDNNEKVLTVFSKLQFNNDDYYLAFSMPESVIISTIARYYFLVGAISLIIIFLIIILFRIYIRRQAHMEQSLRKSEEALRKIVHYMPVGVVLVDQQNRIRQANKAALKLFSFDDEDQLVGRTANDQILFENKTRLDKTTYSAQSNKYVLYNKKGEESVILHEQMPFYLLNEQYSLQVFIEVSSLEKERKSEEMANKAKSTFIANISHELRTPLNGIIGMTDLMLSSDKTESDKDLLEVVKRSANTLLALINDILDISKMEAGRFEIESIPFNLHNEVVNTISIFIPQAKEKNLKLSWDSEIALPENYIGDPIRIRQILNNLISNAIKFTVKGQIHLNISQTRGINGSPAILFSVKDTGIGIRKEKLSTIFDSFAQEDESISRQYGGTGLGITISKQLVNMMGGEIWVNSPSGISDDEECPGAEFYFTIPNKSETRVKSYNFAHINSFKKIRALIISDEPLQVGVIIKNLSSLWIDYKVLPPSNETIDIIKTDNKHHILILDNRPDFNGLEFLESIHNHHLHKKIPIIIQSSDYEPANTSVAKRLGADAYFRKPIEFNKLKESILNFFPNIQEREINKEELPVKSLSVLVTEDNMLNQRIAKSLFAQIGCDIDIANNGFEAVEKIKEGTYDIVFMDIMMPEKGGIEATKEMKKLGLDCPVIAMTSSVDKSEKALILEAGMDDFITKPANKEDLTRMITKWCYT